MVSGLTLLRDASKLFPQYPRPALHLTQDAGRQAGQASPRGDSSTEVTVAEQE